MYRACFNRKNIMAFCLDPQRLYGSVGLKNETRPTTTL